MVTGFLFMTFLTTNWFYDFLTSSTSCSQVPLFFNTIEQRTAVDTFYFASTNFLGEFLPSIISTRIVAADYGETKVKHRIEKKCGLNKKITQLRWREKDHIDEQSGKRIIRIPTYTDYFIQDVGNFYLNPMEELSRGNLCTKHNQQSGFEQM